MSWQSYDLTLTFTATDPGGFVEELLLGVVDLFADHFLGHAKAVVTTGESRFFASTTGIPSLVIWNAPLKTGRGDYRLEAVWIFLRVQTMPQKGDLDGILSAVAAAQGVKFKPCDLHWGVEGGAHHREENL